MFLRSTYVHLLYVCNTLIQKKSLQHFARSNQIVGGRERDRERQREREEREEREIKVEERVRETGKVRERERERERARARKLELERDVCNRLAKTEEGKNPTPPKHEDRSKRGIVTVLCFEK
jgi:hypothetical protein